MHYLPWCQRVLSAQPAPKTSDALGRFVRRFDHDVWTAYCVCVGVDRSLCTARYSAGDFLLWRRESG